MDEIDHAQELDENFRAQALRAHFKKKKSPFIKGEDVNCIDCGEEIEPARRKAKPDAVRCVDCQGKWERRRNGND